MGMMTPGTGNGHKKKAEKGRRVAERKTGCTWVVGCVVGGDVEY